MNSANKISLTIVFCSILIMITTIITAFFQIKTFSTNLSQPAAQALSQPTALPTDQTMNHSQSIQWEYLSLSYSQGQTYDSDVPRYEAILVNEPYKTMFDNVLYNGCSSDPNLLKCVGKNFQGLEYFINILGKDGWEAFSFVNTSSQAQYQIELLFKRSIQ